MDQGSEEIFCVVRAVLGARRRRQEGSPPVNARTSPSQGRGDRQDRPPHTRLHGTRKPRLVAYDVL
jgi:hypothetical protein